MFSVPSENRGECLGEFESRSVKTRDAVDGFYLFKNCHKLCRGFHQAMKARRISFVHFIELFEIIIFRLNKEKDDIRSSHLYFNFFHETVNCPNLEITNHIAHKIFLA